MKGDALTEIRAGITTFITMSYIIFVNPAILSQAGMPKEGVLFATCVASFVATLIMGLWANYPFALAPGMGLNAFFTYGVVLGMGYSWKTALGAVFIEGLIFILLTLTRARSYLVNIIPPSIRIATSVGIGLFIALIGLKNAGIVVASKATLVKLGDLRSFEALSVFFVILLTAVLMVRGVKGAILISIIFLTVLGIVSGRVEMPHKFFGFPSASALFKMDLSAIGDPSFWKVVFAFLFVDLFDTIGTLTACGVLGKFFVEGELPRVERALLADAVGTTVGAVLGTSTVTTYIESSAGVAEGGRTGLTAVVVALLFLLSLPFYPLVSIVPVFATAPALVIVGIMMTCNIKEINWHDFTEAVPAFLTMFFMPVTYSIANGLAVGFISYPLIKLLTGKSKEISPVLWFLCALFIFKMFIL